MGRNKSRRQKVPQPTSQWTRVPTPTSTLTPERLTKLRNVLCAHSGVHEVVLTDQGLRVRCASTVKISGLRQLVHSAILSA